MPARPGAARKGDASVTRRPILLAHIGLAALAMLAAARPAVAQAPKITSVVPGAASAEATVRVTGSGFGATTDANEVTFTPAGGVPVAGTITAVSAPDATGTLRRLTVRVPQGLPVGTAAVTVRNTATGLTGAGASLEVVEFSASPSTVGPGQALDLEMALQGNAAFDPVANRVTLGAGLTVNSVRLSSPTRLTVNVTVNAAAALGPRNASVLTPVMTAVRAGALQVVAQGPPNAPPVAVIAGPRSGEVGTPLVFDGSQSSDPDGDPLTYEWSFGDGATAAGVAATHAYAGASGSPFTVTLTVRDGRGGVGTAQQTVAVSMPPPANRAPTAVLTATPATPQVGAVVVFDASGSTDPDGDVLSYSWTFGDGAVGSGVVASHAYATRGPFTVTLTVDDGRGGIATAQSVVAPTLPPGENRAPTAVITSFARALTGAPLVFDGRGSFDPDGDGLSYRWQFGDGAEGSGPEATHAFASAGSYVVTLTVSDGRGGDGTATRTVTIAPPPAQNQAPTAVIVAPSAGTTGQPVIFASTGSGDPDGDALSFVWAFGDGTSGGGVSVAKTFASPGPFIVTLTASDGRGGVATTTHAIAIAPPAQTNASPSAVILSADRVAAGQPLLLNGGASSDPDGDPLAFLWSFEGGGTAAGESASHTFAGAGTFTVSLTVTDGRGGSDTATRSIRVDEATANRAPRAVIGGAGAGVTGVELIVDGRGSSDPEGDALTFAWTSGVAGASSAGATAAFTYDQPGTFTVTLTVTDTAGNSDTATRAIVIEAAPDRTPPLVTLGGPAAALPGAQVLFTAVATDDVGVTALRFEVDGLAGAEPTELPAPPFTRALTLPAVASPGQQVRVTATARDAAGNAGTATAVLTIASLPDISDPVVALSAPPRAAAGEAVTLLARVADDRGVARVVFLLDGAEVGAGEVEPFQVTATVPAGARPGTFVLALARAVDLSGNTAESAAQIAVVAAPDTAPPTVVLDTPAEVIAGAMLPILATAQDDTGVAAVTFDVSGITLPAVLSPPYEASYPVPGSALPGSHLTIRAVARDFSDNAGEATRSVKVVAPPSSTRGVVSGEVYDDTTGLPLPGVTVTLTGTAASGGAYGQTTVTDARGRYVLRAAAGTGRLLITSAGYTRVDRAVTIRGGMAVEAFDARLTPAAGGDAIVSSVLGGTVEDSGVSLAIEPGSLAADAAIRLVAVGQQGLVNRLPAGWSPVAGVDVAPWSARFMGGAQLRAGNTYALPSSTPLVLARYDEAEGAWLVVGGVAVDGSRQFITGTIDGGGQYAVLLADTVPAAPPAAAAGGRLRGLEAPVLPTALDASLAPRPRVLFYAPGARSVVSGRVAGATPLSSGAPLQARVSEIYTFHDAGVATVVPFVADLTFFQTGAGTNGLGASTPVTPSLVFEAIALREGVITVDLFVPPQGGATPIAGPDGSTIAGRNGESLLVPFGALEEQTPIVLDTLAAADLGLALPQGFGVIAALQIDFQGRFAAESILSVPAPPGFTDAGRLLLLQVQDVGGQTHLVLRGVARLIGDRLVTSTRVGDQATVLTGVRDPGRYLLVEVDGAIGFAAGQVTAADASPAAGAVVFASTLPLTALTTVDGRFFAAGRAGANLLTARDLARSDVASKDATLVAGAVAPVGLSLSAQPPRVTRVSPADQATDVALSTPVVITFSEPIDPASIAGSGAGHVLLVDAGGAIVAGSLALSGGNSVLTFRPGSPLLPNTRYTVLVGTGVRDVSGYGLTRAFQASFLSLDTAPPPPPPAGAITAAVPDAQGRTTVRATQGSASPRDTVRIVNVTTGAITPVLVDPDGGFTVVVPVSLKDRLRVRIADAAGNETVVDLGAFRQVNADGSVSTVVGSEGGIVEGPGGTGARIKPGTFPDGAVVRIGAVDVATLPVHVAPELAGVLSMQAALEVDFGGATPQQYVDLMFPARGDERPDGDWIVTQVVEFYGQRLLNAVDTAKFKQGRIVTSSPPCPGVLAAGVYGAMRSTQSVGINYSQFYNQYGTQWPMNLETSFVPVGGFIALPFVSLSPVVAPFACYPVLSGRATVVPNGTRIRVSGESLAPNDREVLVTNSTRGTTQRFARNVVELTLDMTGTLADAYTVKVAGPGGEQAVSSLVISASPQSETVTLRLDMDLITVPVATVTIRNLTRDIERVYDVPLPPFEVGVAGGGSDGYRVEVVTAGGQKRTVAFVALGNPYGSGNYLLKVQPGTIDPSASEVPPGTPGKTRTLVRLTSSGGLNLVVSDDKIVAGGAMFAFDAEPTDEFRLTIEYTDGTHETVRIPSFRLTVTNPQTGRVIKTIIAPAPPRDEPLELSPISDDVRPPRVISGPTRQNSFDPAGVIEFRFSEPMNAASIANVSNFVVRDAQGRVVGGEFRVSDFNRRITFVPAAPLKLGQEYSVTLKGNDALGDLLEPGGGGMTDRSGNALPTLRLTLKTFTPRLMGTVGSAFAFKDPVVRAKTVEGPGGPQRRTYVVATTAGTGDEEKVVAIDVTDPAMPQKRGGSSAKAPSRQLITVLEGASFTDRDGQPFSGALAFTSTFNTYYTFGDWYDVTDPAAPRHLGGKIFTTNPDNTTGFNDRGTLKVLGFGKGVAMLPTSQGVTSYIAIEKVGVAAAAASQNVPERGAQDRVLEPYYAGDFTDVATYGAQLVALERSARRLEMLSPDLAPTAALDLPDVPRRVRTVTGLAVDVDKDGLITPEEQFDLAVVGAEGAVLLVDLRAADAPQVISRIPLPGVTVRSLDVDVERKRLFASDFSRVFMIDLSRPTQAFSSDADRDGYDDRVIWHVSGSANGVAADPARGLIYVTTDTGLDVWAVYDNCCDLGVDLVAPTVTRQVGDRETLLARERLGLQTGIAKGLVAGACGPVTILEQGSGACLWKSNPIAACSDNYQPGLSDHDFEVFVADVSAPGTKACIDALSAEFTDPVTRAPKEIPLSTGGAIAFEDISFFPVSRAEFENARLNVNPPVGSGSDGAVGDLGLGRQQLLLKWLLEGEYIDVPGQSVAGLPLDQILDRLRTQTGIPRLEGHEWGNLMAFNLAKSKVYLRIAGATSGESAFYEFNLKQLHDAGKAGIRATLARLVDHAGGAALVLDITREQYALNGCRAISPLIENPMEWPTKPCTSFEEYVASAAAQSLLTIPSLNIFTRDEVALQVNRFYRVKADQERIGDDATAAGFLRLVHRFVSDTVTTTAPTFNALVGQDPNASQRLANVARAVSERAAAMTKAKVHVVPRVYNRGFRAGQDLSVKYFVRGPGQGTTEAGSTRVSLAGGDEQYLAYKRNPDGTIQLDADGAAVKQFTLGPIDMTQALGQLGHFAFTIDLPERTMQEAVRENNIGGAFYYVLDPGSSTLPSAPPTLPNPPGADAGALESDPGCEDAPSLRVSEAVIIDGQPHSGTVTLGTGQRITVRLQVRNFSGEAIGGVAACDTLGNLCYDVGTLAPGQTWTKDITFTVPEVGAVVEGQPSAFSATAGVQAGAPLRIVSSCEAYLVTTYDPDPNPVGDASTVMAGGRAVRWYRVIRRDTGDPAPGVAVQVTTTGSVTGTFTFTTDAEGVVSVGSVPGLAIEAPSTASGPFTAKFTKVGGANFACTIPPEFTVIVKDFEFTDALKLGGAVSGAFALATGKASLGLGGSFTLALTGQQNGGGSPTFSKLQLSRSAEVRGGFGVEGALFKVGLAAGATAQLSGPAATASAGVALTAGDKFLFPTLPLSPGDGAAVAGILLDSASRANILTGPGGVIGGWVLRRLANLATGYEQKRISYSGGVAASAGAGVSVFSFKAGLGNALFEGDPAFAIGLGADAKGTLAISFENRLVDQQIVGAVDLSAEAAAALTIDAATLAQNANIDAIPADVSVRKAQKDQMTKIGTRLKTVASFGGGVSEGGRIIVTVDGSGGSLSVKKIEASFVGRKQFGMKVLGSAVTNDGEGRRETVTYTAEQKKVIDEILKVMPAVTALASPAAVSGIPNPAVGGINLPGPTAIYEKIVEFARLILADGTYTVSLEKGNGLAVPLGFNIRVLGTGVDVLATPSADHTVSHTQEKGVFRGAREFRLEDYSGVNVPLQGGLDTVATMTSAITGISFAGDPGVSPAQRSFNENTGEGEISTTHSARLRLRGRADYDRVRDVIGLAYTGVAGPLRPEPYRPAQTEGPTGRPRYGLGGFHYFDPAGATLENPATLVMDYYDDELSGLDEASIRIYRWNDDRNDWDYVGGDLDMATNTVTTTVTGLGTYTLGARMPAGDIAFTVLSAQVSDAGLPSASTVVVLESSVIGQNDGSIAPAGTVIHLRSLAPFGIGGDEQMAFGVITSPDASEMEGVQAVVGDDGRIRLTVELPGVQSAVRLLAFSDAGTALGDRVTVWDLP